MKMPKNRRAFALVLVLIALVISSSMAVFFLTSVARERLGVNLYATGTEVHHLAGMPVSQVIGQINAATKEGTAANPVSWASQPGMIRTYDTSGAAKSIYKLYSWNDVVESGVGYDPSTPAQLPPNDWKKETAHYVDINQPVNDVYPIVDPRAEGEVAGFSVNEGNAVVGGADRENAPMPVKWLYVLEDGQMVAPNGGSGSLANIPGASTANPIIGRVAFWTDDETCKVNINTASEGACWDVPRSGSPDDMPFAANPLTKNEFHRIPGHPALTSLSAVFPEILGEDAADPTKTRWTKGATYLAQMKAILEMSPRLSWGSNESPNKGSRGGTFPVTTYNYDYPPPRGSISVDSLPRPVDLDTDRLYAIADDFWFKPERAANAALNNNLDTKDFQKRLFFLTANSRAPETTLFETPRVSLWPITWPNASSYYTLRKTKNKSSKLQPPTAFNDPITDSSSQWITAEERLIAFCGSLNSANSGGGDRYYFQRKDPDSPRNDWDNSTFPAYSKRNRDLVAYLTAEMAKPAPGFGKSLKDSLGGEEATNWIGLNTFNYIRSQVNQYTMPNAVEGVRYSFAGVSGRNVTVGGISLSSADYSEPNAKLVIPLRPTIGGKEYLPAATYPVLEEAVVVFYAAERDEPVPPVVPPGVALLPSGEPDPKDPFYPEWRNPYNWGNLINFDGTNGYTGRALGDTGSTATGTGARTKVMRAVMLLDFAGMEPGVAIHPKFWVKVKGSSFKVNTGAIGLPTTSGLVAQCEMDSRVQYTPSAANLMDKDEVAKIFSNKAAPAANVWQLVSSDISVKPSDVDFSFTGSNVTIEIYACKPDNVDVDPTSDSSLKVYEKTLDFTKCSNGNYPMPMAPRWSTASRAYRFNSDGSKNTTTDPKQPSAGILPGGLLAKGIPADANMQKFYRPPNASDDMWQPNPDYSTAVAGASGPSTAWAWSEYIPACSGIYAQTLPDTRSVDGITRVKREMFMYVYRASIADYKWQADDEDDARETTSDLKRHVSTNFRKRVEAADTSNDATRITFCLEGHPAQGLKGKDDHKDWNSAAENANLTDVKSTETADFFFKAIGPANKESSSLMTPYDTVISMVNKPKNKTDDLDPRLALISASPSFYSDDFDNIKNVMTSVEPSLQPALVVSSKYQRSTVRSQWHQFGNPEPIPPATGYRILPSYNGRPFARSVDDGLKGTPVLASMPGLHSGIRRTVPVTGDWTGMPGRYADGGVLVRPDQEYQQLAQDTSGDMWVPYYNRQSYGDYTGGNAGGTALTSTDTLSFFSPNRQIPSPVLLGTLPRKMNTDWQTLAFSPNPASSTHPGLAQVRPTAPDHLLLDLFWMPVAEPYPVSDQLSTAGKVNLNYRMMPFPYIERKTALYAAMKNTWITALFDNADNESNYKSSPMMRTYSTATAKTRYAIDVAQTLLGFDKVFDAGDLFRSASQLCEMYLVPKGQTLVSTLATFWMDNRLTPDNAREQPYNDLYSRVTTKSNTFTVHWRVQSLRKAPGTDVAVWDEVRDRRVSELRGATLIERYIDPNTKDDPTTPANEGIPDYATTTDPEPLTRFYKWRVVSENYFQP